MLEIGLVPPVDREVDDDHLARVRRATSAHHATSHASSVPSCRRSARTRGSRRRRRSAASGVEVDGSATPSSGRVDTGRVPATTSSSRAGPPLRRRRREGRAARGVVRVLQRLGLAKHPSEQTQDLGARERQRCLVGDHRGADNVSCRRDLGAQHRTGHEVELPSVPLDRKGILDRLKRRDPPGWTTEGRAKHLVAGDHRSSAARNLRSRWSRAATRGRETDACRQSARAARAAPVGPRSRRRRAGGSRASWVTTRPPLRVAPSDGRSARGGTSWSRPA